MMKLQMFHKCQCNLLSSFIQSITKWFADAGVANDFQPPSLKIGERNCPCFYNKDETRYLKWKDQF